MKPGIILFFERFVSSLATFVKIMLLSKFFIRKPAKALPGQQALLLGNGPSLSDFLNTQQAFLKGKVLFSVNYFVRTKEFETTRPQNYILVAPDFWQQEEKAGWKEERYKIFESLADKSRWPMNLFVPTLARKHSEWKKIIASNKFINIYYINITPVEGFAALNHFYFQKWLGMPRPHNVLVATLWVALNMRFETIYIAGADHSWMQEIMVADNNQVFLSQKHFYDSQLNEDTHVQNRPDAKPMYVGTTKRERRLHEIIHKFYYSFRSYWELNDYAKYLGSKVYNITKGSFIDAFEKMKI